MHEQPTGASQTLANSRSNSVTAALLLRVAISNLPFVLMLLANDQLHEGVQALCAGSIVLLIPGLAWVDRRVGDAAAILLQAFAVSLAAGLVSWLLLMLPPGPTNRTAFLVALCAITNVGLFVGARRGWYDSAPFSTSLARVLLVLSALFFAQSYLGAAYRVPMLDDQDMETQGTAYGLMHHFEPTIALDRGGRFFFAHPLLLHYFIGASTMITDDLDRLQHYHEGSLEVAAGRTDEYARFQVDAGVFHQDPVLLPTRTPNIFFAAMLIFPLGFIVFRLSGSQAAAALAGVLYATLPEVYVRSSYGGYMALTNFIALGAAYFFLQSSGYLRFSDSDRADVPRALRYSVVAGFLGGWTNQKFLLVPAAAGSHAVLRGLLDGGFTDLVARLKKRPEFVAAFLLTVGFLVGWLSYAIYGFSVSPAAFLKDHVKGHVVGRLLLRNVNIATDQATTEFHYLSIVGLWRQFAEHSGWLFIAAALVAIGWVAFRRIRSVEGIFLGWIAIGALGFSMVDWRMTKHLSKILPPTVVLMALCWAALKGRARVAFAVLLCCAIAWNVWTTTRVMADFEFIKPVPLW